ncbi:MAG: glycosyltransferase family 4 protein [Deltaproteobacteria bacterium]|nr:glycosyltransferase family 4 protein [Deltaproteobacteria bacterium]
MHILFLTENYPPEHNAAATRVAERAVYWRRAGHQVTIITSHPNFPSGKLFEGYTNCWRQEEVIDGIRVIRVKTYIAPNSGVIRRVLDFLSFMFVSALNGLRERDVDVVVATSPQFFTAVSGWFVAKVKRKPFIFELSDLWPASVRAVGAIRKPVLLAPFEWIELFLYQQAARVVALTNSFKVDLVERGIPPHKIEVIVNGVELEKYQPRPKDPNLSATLKLQHKFVIGYVGTIGMAHGLSSVVDAAAILKEFDEIAFLFVGNGAELAALKSAVEFHGLENVILVGAKPKAEIQKYWSLCDISLVSLRNQKLFEGVIPSKIFESMGMGKPILYAGPKGEATNIIESCQAGLCVAAENPMELANAVLSLRQNRQQLAIFEENSQKSAARFSRRQQALLFLQVIEQVCAARQLQAQLSKRTGNV